MTGRCPSFGKGNAMEDIKSLVQIANRIQKALMRSKNSRYLELMRQLKSFAGQLQEVTAESRRMGASLAHGWFLAADRCCNSVSRLLHDIPYSVSRIQQLTDVPRKEMPKLSMLVQELNQVQQEFGNMEFDAEENTISVVTEAITLEDIYLGPFKIQLELGRLSELYTSTTYRLIALDPHPAATSEDVTHPHVSNEQLCEGDGSVAVRAALEQGRLSDFFTMVRSILNTYNPDSPYISLNEWNGEPCYECGYVMSSENGYYCSFCDRAFCEECTTYCRSCDETICVGCAAQCETCEESVCPRCARTRCIECESVCCESCIDEGLCPDCKQERKNEDEEQERQIKRTNESGAQANNTEIKLAS
jgi:hypothetical protein